MSSISLIITNLAPQALSIIKRMFEMKNIFSGKSYPTTRREKRKRK